LLARFGAPSFSGLKNVNNPLHRAAAGGELNTAELLRIGFTLRALRSLYEWYGHFSDSKSGHDFFFENIKVNKYLEEKIFNVIVSEEEIADRASDELFEIRRKIRAKSNSIREKLDSIIHSAHYQKYLQEAIVTQRGGRYVVPVKAENRANVQGLVHDTSASGATVFIERFRLWTPNNEIKMLEAGKKRKSAGFFLSSPLRQAVLPTALKTLTTAQCASILFLPRRSLPISKRQLCPCS
jgi:DNA mismatch repair protein MutS2